VGFRSIRAKLLAVFAIVALLGVGGVAGAALRILRERALAQAFVDAQAARAQLRRLLNLRYEAFQAVSDLSYVLPVFRQVAAQGQDEADFGLGSAQDDQETLKTLHQNLVDADWNWAKVAGGGWIGVADGKGRVLFASADKEAWSGDAKGLDAVAKAFEAGGSIGAMVVDGRDPKLMATGLVGKRGKPCLFVVFARATVLGGQPRAVFVQGIPAAVLLQDIALGERDTALALVTLDGHAEGKVPGPVLAAALKAPGGEAVQVNAAGVQWLAQRQPLKDLTGKSEIAGIMVARNLDVGLALLLQAGTLLLAVAAGVLAVALVLGAVFARRLSKPIVALEGAARKVAGGDLSAQVAVPSRDEIGRLATAFNRMLEGLRERERIKGTFKKYLAPDVVDYLLANPDKQNPGGERRELTVTFSDIAGFTSFSETRKPEAVVEVLNRCLTDLSHAVSQAGGTLDKYIGDNVMAFYGAPIPQADHAVRACRSALRQLEAIQALRPKWEQGDWPVIGLRIGMNTGDMIVGSIGGENGQDYTVIGDAVNLASRLEAVNKVYGTKALCTESTWRAAKDAIAMREVDQIRVAGKQQPVRIFEIVAEASELADTKRQVIAAYERGLAAYRARNWSDAAAAFDEALAFDSADEPSKVMADRLRKVNADPPGEHWDGVWTLKEK
jgi:class 3 adenylate cyclase